MTLPYGSVVRLVAGPYCGWVVYYEEDAPSRGAVVYFGTPYLSKSKTVPKRWLRKATFVQQAEFDRRYLSWISPTIRERFGI